MRRTLTILALACAACTAHVASPADDHAAHDHAIAADLAATLAVLPGVTAAHAIVTTPWSDPLAPPAPPARAAATIALSLAPGVDASPVERDARRLAAAALHADPADITIALASPSPSLPAAELAKLGPFEVAARDRTALAITLVAALAIIAALAAWIAALSLRARRR